MNALDDFELSKHSFSFKDIIGLTPRNLYLPGTITSGGALAGSNITAWTSWTPTRTGWTDIGAPTVTARKAQVGNIGYLQVKVVPGTTVATAAGTSYINLPIAANASSIGGDGSMMNLTTLVGVGNIVIDTANSRLYVPTQAATGNTLSIAAWWEV